MPLLRQLERELLPPALLLSTGHRICCQSQLSSCQQRKFCTGQENLLSAVSSLCAMAQGSGGSGTMHWQPSCWTHTKCTHGTLASAPACSAFPYQLCSCLSLGAFLIYCVCCIVIFQSRLIARVTAPGRREDYLINVCEALLDPHMKAARKRNI